MKNYKVILAYKGTAYHGFQRQSNANTIQQEVEEALGRLLGENVTIYGCSRTDAGVHARAMVASVFLDTELTCDESRDYMNRYRTVLLFSVF